MRRNLFWSVIICIATALSAAGATMSLADARGKIGAVIADPSLMQSTMAQLATPEDQCSFLGAVNSAIAKMPGSPERRAAKFAEINRAAFKGAKKGNLANLVAEMYATVTIEALTVINERFGAELFNRSANSGVTFTDEQFKAIAVAAMKKIRNRTKETDNSDVRDTLAALMFVRASNGSPKDLANVLTADMDADVREVARKEWIPRALNEASASEGQQGAPQTGDYDTMLDEAGAGEKPDVTVILRLYAPQMMDAMLADIASGIVDVKGNEAFPVLNAGFGWGNRLDAPHETQNPVPEIAPGGYQWQKID